MLTSPAQQAGGTTAARPRVALFVAYFFPPLGGGGVQRTVKFLKYLRPLGWRGEVITVKACEYWVADQTLAADVPADTTVWRTASLTGLTLLAGWSRRGRRRVSGDSSARATAPRSTRVFRLLRWLSSCFLVPDAYVGWLPFALRVARRRLRAGVIDVLITTSSPDTAHLIGLWLRPRLHVPWVADFRDPWVRRMTFQAPTPFHRWLHTLLERRVLEVADRVLVTNEATRDDFLARHASIPAARFVVIPNGFDPEDLGSILDEAAGEGLGDDAGRDESLPAESSPAESPPVTLELLHAGLLSGLRTLAPIASALEEVFAERPELRGRLRLTQVGPRERLNDWIVAERGLESTVRFLPPVPHGEILSAMRAAGALLLLEHAGARGALITPGKIFEYLASGRPILALVPEGPAAKLVRELGAGEVIQPDDRQAIVGVLTRWIESGPPASGVTRTRLRPYERAQLAERLARVLDEISTERPGSPGAHG